METGITNIDFSAVAEFEKKIAEFFGAPYAVAVDSCTHGVELCLRYKKANCISVPKHTYLSIPMLASKLGIKLVWRDHNWKDYYCVHSNIYDAAVLWRRDSYIENTFMCVSFQYQKHLNLSRGGIILCSTLEDYNMLKKMSYDGRMPNIPWREQNIEIVGYHYYMTPETAQRGLERLPIAIETQSRQWVCADWPDVSKMTVFNR